MRSAAASTLILFAGLNGAFGQHRPVAGLTITIPAFPSGGAIPAKYACTANAEDSPSPAIQWSGAPAGTKSFALILHDVDTPIDFLHWAIFNIPGSAAGLPENVPDNAALKDGSVQLRNSNGSFGYFNPCPPGGRHRYRFDVFALDAVLNPAPNNRAALLRAMNGHVIARGQYMGTFGR